MSRRVSVMNKDSRLLSLALVCALIGTTVAITPWFSYDPINLPKQTTLVTFSFFFIPILVKSRKIFSANSIAKLIILLFSLFVLSLLVSMIVNQQNFAQQFWGTWGRSNGFLSYFALSLIFFISYLYAARGQSERLLRLFLVTSYAVTIYTIIQYLQLDPFDWSLKLPFAFFGNINFMSAFLGLACTLILSIVLFDRLPWSSNLFFLSLVVTNLWLIYETESIQGIAIFAIGSTISFFLYLHKVKGNKYSIPFALTSTAIGSLSMLGTAGLGPLGNLLVQQTVIYRTDYWRAGIEAFKSNIWFGVGIDSFGDYYTQYRDFLAATRTGPQRVVNTSHNVIIDLLANGGIFVGVILVCLLLVIFSVSGFLALSREAQNTEIKLLPLFSGWFFFLSVSINQLGVTIWGYVFGGMIIGIFARKAGFELPHPINGNQGSKKAKIERENKVETSSFHAVLHLGRMKLVSSVVCGLIGLIVSGIPLWADANFLSALKSQNVTKLAEVNSMLGASTVHKNKYLEFLTKNAPASQVYLEAKVMAKEDPRNYYAWNIIAQSEGIASTAERRAAIDVLISLDPYNDSIEKLKKNLDGKD